MQRPCVLLKLTSLFQCTRTLKYTKENNPRFSLNVKKPNLFSCQSCSQSYWITFAEIFQKYSGWGKQLARKISVQTLKVLQILWKTLRYYNGKCWATFLIGGATNLLHSQELIYFIYHGLHYQLPSTELKTSSKTKPGGKQRAGGAATWTCTSPVKRFCGQSGWWETPKDSSFCVCHGITKPYHTHPHAHVPDREGFHNMSSLCLSQGHVPESHSQADWRSNMSGAVQAVEIKLSQAYFSRLKRNPRCMFKLAARKRIPGQATGNPISML